MGAIGEQVYCLVNVKPGGSQYYTATKFCRPALASNQNSIDRLAQAKAVMLAKLRGVG